MSLRPPPSSRVLLVSRQSLYRKCKPRPLRIVKPAPRPVVREVVISFPIGPDVMPVEEALIVLARRHVAYGTGSCGQNGAGPATS